jgi:nicotinamidase-related amidase
MSEGNPEFKLSPTHTAIVVIDIQRGIVVLPGSPLPTQTVIDNIARLLTAARRAVQSLCSSMSVYHPTAPTGCVHLPTCLRA